MKYRFKRVEMVRYPVLLITFDDGLADEIDFSQSIADLPIFAPLKDDTLFRTVRIADNGRVLGWRLDDPGHEIDLCVDATRIEIETALAVKAAQEYRQHGVAAE